jgi:HAD superfamily hydrolase (TIGR01490 family)
LISGVQAVRGALAQIVFRLGGADHKRMEKIKNQVSKLCCGWPVDRVTEIVTNHLADAIGPFIYSEARRLMDAHRAAGRDVIIVSTSGQEMVGPIGIMLGATEIIATRMGHADGVYTGELEFYAYGEAKAIRIRELSAERGYRLADCFAYSDSVTDLPMLEAVGHPHAVNPDRHLRKIAVERGWPVLAFELRPAESAATCEPAALPALPAPVALPALPAPVALPALPAPVALPALPAPPASLALPQVATCEQQER